MLNEFDAGFALILSRDGKCLVRMTLTKDVKKWGVELWSLDNET